MDFTNLTKEQQLGLAKLDPEFVELAKARPVPEYDFSDVNKLIMNLRQALKQWHTGPSPGVTEKDMQYQNRDGISLRLQVYSPESPPQPNINPPVFVLYFGGGFTIGSPESLAPICRVVAKTFGAICVAPDYKQAPEDCYPAAINDSWDAFKWIVSRIDEFGGSSSSKIIVGGISAGGKIATIVSHLARDENIKPSISGVWLAASSCVYPENVPDKYKHMYLARSQNEVLNAPITNHKLSRMFEESYKPDKHSELASPLNWPSGHRGLPPTFLQVCGTDIVRDDSLIYEKVLREEAGVQTMLKVYPGWPHIFFQVFPMASKSEKFYADTLEGFGWLLRGK